MTEEQEYLETKKLILSKNMNGYEIPHSYLCNMLEEFTQQQVKKLNIDDVSKRVILDKMINEMQEVDDEHHLSIACKYLNDC